MDLFEGGFNKFMDFVVVIQDDGRAANEEFLKGFEIYYCITQATTRLKGGFEMAQTMGTGQSISMMVPILPGKRDQLLRFAADLTGPRAEEYAHSQQSVVKETWHLQETPMGDFLIINFDAPDPAAVFAGLAESTDPFDVWFRQQAQEISGIDFSRSIGALPKLVFQYQRK